MSSSQQPPDCALQLPSWDEFDQAEELDYSEHESVPEEEELHDPENENRSLPHANLNHEGASNNDDSPSVPNYEGHNSQDSSVTVFSLDQLPNSVPEYRDQPSSSRMIGPALPPGFPSNSHDEDEDPEDPGDPEDPNEGGLLDGNARKKVLSGSYLPRIPLSTSRGRVIQIGPTLPPGFGGLVAPSLPDDEIRIHNHESNVNLPPPEPEEARSTVWPSKSNGMQCERTVSHVFPDILPTVSSMEPVTDDNETYGPALPQELRSGPSTSRNHEPDLEMPIQGDEEVSGTDEVDTDEDIVGPVPPFEQNPEKIEHAYAERLAEYKIRNLTKSLPVKREEWMVRLPKKLNHLGMGARTFSKSSTETADKSSVRAWTETPQERMSRLERGGDEDVAGPSHQFEEEVNAKRDQAQEKIATALNADRNESLLDIHSRKRKRKDDCLEGRGEVRRPFDRERDMEIRGLRTEVSSSEIKDHKEQLNSRFSHSSTKKFL